MIQRAESNEIFVAENATHLENTKACPTLPYTDTMSEIISVDFGGSALRDIARWDNYAPTPLVQLPGFAKYCNVGEVFYKDESQRFGLKSFKALGGAYAVAKHLIRHIKKVEGVEADIDDLLNAKFAHIVSEVTITAATDGNHGRSVAWGCEMFGCRCVIYIHAHVSAGRQEAMRALGAEVIRISGNYDDSVKEADRAAKQNGWVVVSDNSYPGYMEIPKDVMRGYSVMLQEAADQLDGKVPSHIFIQGGCGGLASAVAGYFWDLWGEQRPRLVIVEPEKANCLQLSSLRDELAVVDGDLDTLMAGLACGEVSLLAWEILETGCNDFMTVSESLVPRSMAMLAHGTDGDHKLEAGESAVAGVAALLATAKDETLASRLGLTSQSRVLFFGTEGATDPELYQQLISTTLI